MKLAAGGWRAHSVLVVLFVLAVLVRLGAADGLLTGDEIATVGEARNLGRNLNGIGYLVVFHGWLRLSDSVWGMHLLPSLLGGGAVVLCALWLRETRNVQVAMLAALLLTVAPLAVEYGQQVRFYSAYLCASLLLLWAYALVQRPPEARPRWAGPLLGVAALLVMSTQLLGVLLVLVVAAHALGRHRPRALLALGVLGLALVGGLMVVAALAPDALAAPYSAFARLFDGNANAQGQAPAFSAPRGWTPIIAAKVAFLGAALTIGPHTYPLNWAVTVPAALLLTGLGAAGLWTLWRQQRDLFLLVALASAPVVVVYGVLDPLLPTSNAASASARLVLWLVPLVLWLVVEGVQRVRPGLLRWALTGAVLGTQLLGTANVVWGTWGRSDPRAVAQAVAGLNTPGTLVLAGGRAAGFLDANGFAATRLASPDQPAAATRVVLVNSDQRAPNRCAFSQVLAPLAATPLVGALVRYPSFVYAYDAAAPPGANLLPMAAYHPRYADLALPQVVAGPGGTTLSVSGGFELPTCDNATSVRMVADMPRVAQLTLLSHVVARHPLTDGTAVAQVMVTPQDGGRPPLTLTLHLGEHTQTWNALSGAPCRACAPVLTWRKHAALVGASAYAGAYDDHVAQIYATTLALPAPLDVAAITVASLLPPQATLTLWGVFPQE